MRLSRRAALALPLLAAMPAARAQPRFPDRPVRWLVGYPAGGGSDVLARLLAQHMQARLGQPVVVENRPGAATVLAAEALVRAPADGHTVMSADVGTLVFNPVLYRRLPYDPNTDLLPLGLMARFHLVLAVNAASAAPDAAALLARARAEPGKIDYGSPGVGSPHHLAMERFAREAGVQLNHVPYRGMAPALNDLAAGTVEAAFVDVASGGELLRAGRIRGLGIASRTRFGGFSAIPTLAEALALPAPFEAHAWQGLVAHRDTPAEIAATLSAALAAALAEPAVLARMREIGLDPLSGGAAEQAALQAAEQATWWPVVRALGISLD